MKSRYSLHLILSLFLFVFITSCKEEAIVEQKNENNSAVQSILAKGSDLSSVQGDSTIQQKQKERVKKLKKEHEKPYVVIEKPEKILSDLLKSRAKNKTLSKSSKDLNSNSVQSSQSCYTLEIDVWAFSKYEARAGKEFGILPHPYRRDAGSTGDPNRIQKLNELKSKWGFNYIEAYITDYNIIMAIVNAGFPIATNFMADIQCNQYGIDNVLNNGNGLNPNVYFWAYYVDEPSSSKHLTEYCNASDGNGIS